MVLAVSPGNGHWRHRSANGQITNERPIRVLHKPDKLISYRHYFFTPEVDGPVDRKRPTQVGRALAHLGVEHIAAYSPQARGRSERMFQTLQDRLVKELALAGITTVDAANAFIRDVYLPAHNARFAVKAEQVGFRVRRDHWRRSE